MSARKKAKQVVVPSRLVVVDANIVRGASSTDGGPPVGSHCRKVLQRILSICHRAVVSPALAREYDDHASNFGQRWRAMMMQRSKIIATPARESGRSRGWMQTSGYTQRERAAAEKDLHLVLAAWEKQDDGAVVLSSDDAARALFVRIADLAGMGWARMTDQDIDDWLEQGADPSPVRLGRG